MSDEHPPSLFQKQAGTSFWSHVERKSWGKQKANVQVRDSSCFQETWQIRISFKHHFSRRSRHLVSWGKNIYIYFPSLWYIRSSPTGRIDLIFNVEQTLWWRWFQLITEILERGYRTSSNPYWNNDTRNIPTSRWRQCDRSLLMHSGSC